MSYKNTIEVIQNDYGYNLEGQITDDAGNIVDLTGCTLKLIIYEPGVTPAKIEKTATVKLPATNGEWIYLVTLGDFNVGDKWYNVEVEVTRASPAQTVTAIGAKIYVRQEAPEVS